MEEYQDYDKAMTALSEAKHCLLKSSDDLSSRKAVEAIDYKISTIHKYLKARKIFDSGSQEEAMDQCNQLLRTLDRNSSIVRVGDVYALMIKNAGEMSKSREL